MGQCYAISADVPFLDCLAEHVLSVAGQSADLSAITLLLPNRRSCRHFSERLLARSGQDALLLPQLMAVGDVEEEPLHFFGDDAGINSSLISEISQPISGYERVCKMVAMLGRYVQKNSAPLPQDASQEALFLLAESVLALSDDVARYELSWQRLQRLVPEQFAAHWQEVLSVLSLLTQHWPQEMQKSGLVEPVVHRIRLMQRYAEYLRDTGKKKHVILAGSTGSQPATRRLMKTIMALEHGAVILPVLNKALLQYAPSLPPSHPHYMVQNTIADINTSKEIKLLDVGSDKEHKRSDFVASVFAPALDGWAQATSSIHTVEAEHPLQEAAFIALMLRDAIEEPKKIAALVTPDRTLARRVCAALKLYGITAQDSAGMVMAHTPTGAFLQLLAEWLAHPTDMVAMLALLKHPVSAGGVSQSACRDSVRQCERFCLRAHTVPDALATLQKRIANTSELSSEVQQWWQVFLVRVNALLGSAAPLRGHAMWEAFCELAEWLATTDEQAGAVRLWQEGAGAQIVPYLEHAARALHDMPGADVSALPVLVQHLLMQGQYRAATTEDTHPRIMILSPMEARLLWFDRVILGGMNEGVWPALAASDAWMNTAMRQAFGLPSADQAMGQAAHDVSSLMCMPEVILTRARKQDGSPAIASRWWQRLHAVAALHGAAIDQSVMWSAQRKAQRQAMQQAVHSLIEVQPIAAPMPVPPVALRPTQLRVTELDILLEDPYAIYARHVLNITPLDALDEAMGNREFGIFVHDVLHHYHQTVTQEEGGHGEDTLLSLANEALAALPLSAPTRRVWSARLPLIAHWFCAADAQRRADASTLWAEVAGQWHCQVDGTEYQLRGRADRVEQLRDGTLAVLDYKTGAMPTKNSVKNLHKVQLPVMALMAEEGAFSAVPAQAVGQLIYWQLTGRNGGGEACIFVDKELPDSQATKHWLYAVLRYYQQPETAYLACPTPKARDAGRFNPYAHLERIAEWG